MSQPIRILPLILTLGGFALMAGSASADERPVCSWSVNAALHGEAPSVRAECLPAGTPVRVLIRTLGETPGGTLADYDIDDAEELHITLPEVDRETFLEITLWEKGASEEAPALVTWTTLRRPGDAPLMDYTGRVGVLPIPDDFDEYWERAKAELAAVAMGPRIVELEEHGSETGRLFRVELATVRDTTVVGWYVVPREAFLPSGRNKKYPAMIIMPGYGAEQPPLDRTADGIITLSMNPRNHGPSRDFWVSPVEHLDYNLDDPENQYYKLAVLDCLRGLEFLFSRAEVDPSRVAAEGGSQGGYFAVALAALDSRLSSVVSNVTAFSGLADGMVLNQVGHATSYRRMLEEGGERAERIRRSLAYMDGAHLASRVQAPTQIIMGGRDNVCHFLAGVVVYNAIPEGIAKEFHLFPGARHEVPDGMRRQNARWTARFWGLSQTPSFPGAILSRD